MPLLWDYFWYLPQRFYWLLILSIKGKPWQGIFIDDGMDKLLRHDRRKQWKFSQGILSWVFLSTLFACSYSEKASRKLLEAAANNPYDLIIVPGVPFEKNKWGRTMKG